MRHRIAFLATFLTLGLVADAVSAQDVYGQQGGILVSGTGEVKAKPNFVEIDLRTAASAELTADAIVKYRDAKRRTMEAFEKLEMKELTLEERGLSLTPGNAQEAMNMAMRGMGGGTPYKMQVEISSTIHVKLGGIRDMPAEQVMETIGKLLDTAQDSGAAVGPSQAEINMAWRYGNNVNGAIVHFVLRDLAEMREEAYEKAVADARRRAERIAKLTNVKVGQVLSVQEQYVSGDDTPIQVQYYGYRQPSATPASLEDQNINSETFAETPFQVKLLVRFAIDSSESRTASNP